VSNSTTSTGSTVASADASSRPSGPDTRSPAEIEVDIERARERLGETVEALTVRTKPANIAKRASDGAKQRLFHATHDERGNLVTQRVAASGGAAAALLVLIVWRRRR
jgi:hypothetical protein